MQISNRNAETLKRLVKPGAGNSTLLSEDTNNTKLVDNFL